MKVKFYPDGTQSHGDHSHTMEVKRCRCGLPGVHPHHYNGDTDKPCYYLCNACEADHYGED